MSGIEQDRIIIPEPLSRGDGIAIVSPATVVREEYVRRGKEILENIGFEVSVGKNICYGEDGSMAGNAKNRVADINEALNDPKIKAIWCARGGYGCVELLEGIDKKTLRKHPKWIIGFSDVCALHALWLTAGIAPLHAPMLRTFGKDGEPDNTIKASGLDYHYQNKDIITYNEGIAQGRLIGGNLSVISDLAATQYDIYSNMQEDTILLFEDVAESISRVERRLWRLHLAGVLRRAKGIIFGRFSSYQPNKNFTTMEEMIACRLREWGVKGVVAFSFPIGHGGENRAVVLGVETKLEIAGGITSLSVVRQ